MLLTRIHIVPFGNITIDFHDYKAQLPLEIQYNPKLIYLSGNYVL